MVVSRGARLIGAFNGISKTSAFHAEIRTASETGDDTLQCANADGSALARVQPEVVVCRVKRSGRPNHIQTCQERRLLSCVSHPDFKICAISLCHLVGDQRRLERRPCCRYRTLQPRPFGQGGPFDRLFPISVLSIRACAVTDSAVLLPTYILFASSPGSASPARFR